MGTPGPADTRWLVAGQVVSTPLGTGVVRELRRNGDVAVAIDGRTVVFPTRVIGPVAPVGKAGRKRKHDAPAAVSPGADDSADAAPRGRKVREVDLHGLVVAEALARVDSALNDAMLGGESAVRFIHGRSGGRIRVALHRHLRGISSVRASRLDPRNEGVTIAEL